MQDARPLQGKIALVAGATRGAGRAIAVELGHAGATVYCTGRSSERGPPRPATATGEAAFDLSRRPETIEQTARLVDAAGGSGVAVRVDHTVEAEVVALAEQIAKEQSALHILVNDVWGGESLVQWGASTAELDIELGRKLLDQAVMSHVITAKACLPLLEKTQDSLLVEVTDGDSMAYRGQLFYDLVKAAVIRLAFGFAEAHKPSGLTAVAVTPGFLRSEAMLDHLEVTEATWREAIPKDEHFAYSETPHFVARGIAALAADPDKAALSGRALASWTLADRYGVTDVNGEAPHWGRHAAGEAFGADQRASHARFVAGVSQAVESQRLPK